MRACGGFAVSERAFSPFFHAHSGRQGSRAQQSALAAPRNGQRKIRRRTPCLLKCDGDRFIPVLFFRLRQLPVSSRPLPSDRDSSAEIAPCPASDSSSASELILETSLAAAMRVGNAALCSCAPVRQDPTSTRAREPIKDRRKNANPGSAAREPRVDLPPSSNG